MITAKLQGGLGNQMFQIAAAFSLSLEADTDCYFDFNNCNTPNQGFDSKKYSNNLFSKIQNKTINFEEYPQYTEPKFSYEKIPSEKKLCLNGYFQSEKYFLQNKSHILNLFNFDDKIFDSAELFFKNKLKKNITTIHVRRGDYLEKLHYHSVCPLDFYYSAMKKLPNNDFIIISDDIEWCKKNMQVENVTFSESNSEIFDLHLMLLSDNIIMSNSTFSWWGSWLNNKKNKVVICPRVWFGEHGPKDIHDLIPLNWIMV
jgi:hypothetical protein